MKIHYAGCCHPIPVDRINGVINTGKGITIHMQNCKQLASINKDGEFINLIWNNNDSNNVFTSRLQITFNNKQGALALITSTISKCKADINNLKIVTRNSDFWEILTDIGVHDRDQLRNIQAHLRSLNIVCQVNRQ
jgi:GTP pyrophosphokinase